MGKTHDTKDKFDKNIAQKKSEVIWTTKYICYNMDQPVWFWRTEGRFQ